MRQIHKCDLLRKYPHKNTRAKLLETNSSVIIIRIINIYSKKTVKIYLDYNYLR